MTGKQMGWQGLAASCLLLLVLVAPLSASQPLLFEAGKGVLQERLSGRMWQAERSKKIRNSSEVLAYLARLNSGPPGDWRLPTRHELHEFFLLFDLKDCGDITLRLEGAYWLQGENGEPLAGSWEPGEQCGSSRTYYPGRAGYVRAVRP